MHKNVIKTIHEIMKTTDSNRITIFTGHLKIDGNIYQPEGRCDECHDSYLTLENALVCKLDDFCSCTEEQCDCNDYVCFRYNWLNVCTNEIVAFSVLK